MTQLIRRPPGPRGRPVLGSLPDILGDPLGFFERCATYGDIAMYRTAHVPIFFLNHPNYVEQVLVTHHRDVIKGRAIQGNPELFGNGLLTSEGELWRRQRQLVQPAFHRERLATYADTMVAATQRTLEGWHVGQVRDIHQELMQLTLEIVARTLFHADVTDDAEEVGAALDAVTGLQRSRRGVLAFLLPRSVPTPANVRFRQAIAQIDRVVYRIIAERRASGRDEGDVLSMLLEAQDEGGVGMSDQQLRDEVMTLFLAGHETSALGLTWACFLLARHPEAEATLRTELDEVLGGRLPSIGDLPRLRFTEAVIKETLRLYPPAYFFSRAAVQPFTLGSYQVEPGTSLVICPWTAHRDPRFFAGPDRFDPERWLEGRSDHLPPYAYLPFGGGPRRCIGQSFAMMEMVLILAQVAQRFQLRLATEQPIRPVPTITLRPSLPVPMILHPATEEPVIHSRFV